MERRLAAIFAAGMAGFSRLMERDEDGVLSRQKLHRHELIDPEIARRIWSTNGAVRLTGRFSPSWPAIAG
jgi:hypothetical protein